MNREQAVKIIEENREELAASFGVLKIGLFGSIVKDGLVASSDIDVVVEIDKEKKRLHNFLELRRYLERKLQRPVDLSIESAIKPVVRDAIAGEIVYV